jgi:hypothetical protein
MLSNLFGVATLMASAESHAYKAGQNLGQLIAIGAAVAAVIWAGYKFGGKK